MNRVRCRPAAPFAVAACAVLLFAGTLGGCTGTSGPQVKVPAKLLYLEAEALADQQLYAEAVTKFEQVASQNPGTRLGSFAYLRIADLQMKQENWPEAETNFRLFLTANSNSHLTSLVLFRLMEAHHENSYTGVFFKSREIDRDMEPNRQIIREYKRFYFLYPKSTFLDEATGFYRDAVETLAAHEHMVADWYYDHEQYNAAASRYLYVLRNYPDYTDSRVVLRQLIRAYRRNQQPDLAAEMVRTYRELFGQSPDLPEDRPPAADLAAHDTAGVSPAANVP